MQAINNMHVIKYYTDKKLGTIFYFCHMNLLRVLHTFSKSFCHSNYFYASKNFHHSCIFMLAVKKCQNVLVIYSSNGVYFTFFSNIIPYNGLVCTMYCIVSVQYSHLFLRNVHTSILFVFKL